MLIRLPSQLADALNARAKACGVTPSEIARRALRRNRTTPAPGASAKSQSVTRADSVVVRLHLEEYEVMPTATIRAALAAQLAATQAAVTYSVSKYPEAQ